MMKGTFVVKAQSRLKSAGAIAGSAMGLFMAWAAFAQNQSLPTVLESGSNDVISLQRGQIPDGATIIAPQSPSKAFKAAPPANLMSGSRSLGKPTTNGITVPASRAKRSAPRPSAKPGISSSIAPTPLGVSGARHQSSSIAAPTTSQLDGVIADRLVTVCLNNAASSSGAKAFDVQRRNAPRFVVGAGKTTCAQFEPTRQTIYFWKTDALGKLALTLSNRLDLRDSEGTQIMLNWEQD